MVWAFYYQEDYVRKGYKNYKFGWRRNASPKKPCYDENPKRRSRKKIGEKTMSMVKIPTRISWAKVT